MRPTIGDITDAIERFASPALQEDYDNSGLIIGNRTAQCAGVLIAFDVTPEVVDEAIAAGCNMIVAHHPLIFKGLKRLNGNNAVERAVIAAVRGGVAVYAAHTSADNTPGGVSWILASKLNLTDVSVLDPIDCDAPGASADNHPLRRPGAGVVGRLPHPMAPDDFLELVKKALGCRAVRYCSGKPSARISRVALCGGSGAFLVSKALGAGADAYVTADVKYHDFADCEGLIMLVDAGHFETELCITSIFYEIITEKFPTFAVRYATSMRNPVKYK